MASLSLASLTTTLLLLLLPLLLLLSQVTGMMQRSTISSHVHTYQVIKTHAPPHLHFANRYHEPLAPFNVSFFGRDFTLHLDIDYDYLQHMAPETLNKIDVTRFLYGHVRGYHRTSIVRVYTYERGIGGHMVIRSETGRTLHYYQFETVVEDDGELSDDVIVFRPQDMMRVRNSSMLTCGMGHPMDEAHAYATPPRNTSGLLNATGALSDGIHLTELPKYGPRDYEGHNSFDVLKLAKSLHLSRPPSYDDPMQAHRMVQHGLRRRALRKRDDTDPDAATDQSYTNKYKAALLYVIYDRTLDAEHRAATWITMLYSRISTRTAEVGFSLVVKYIEPDMENLSSIANRNKTVAAMKKSHGPGGTYYKTDVGAVQLLRRDTPGIHLGHAQGHFGGPSFSFAKVRSDDRIQSIALHEFLHNLGAKHEGTGASIMAPKDKPSIPFADKQWGRTTVRAVEKSLKTSKAWHDVGTLEGPFPMVAGPVGDLQLYEDIST